MEAQTPDRHDAAVDKQNPVLQLFFAVVVILMVARLAYDEYAIWELVLAVKVGIVREQELSRKCFPDVIEPKKPVASDK